MNLPLVCFERLSCAYPTASDRFHTFVLEGVPEMQARLHQLGAGYIFQLPRRKTTSDAGDARGHRGRRRRGDRRLPARHSAPRRAVARRRFQLHRAHEQDPAAQLRRLFHPPQDPPHAARVPASRSGGETAPSVPRDVRRSAYRGHRRKHRGTGGVLRDRSQHPPFHHLPRRAQGGRSRRSGASWTTGCAATRATRTSPRPTPPAISAPICITATSRRSKWRWPSRSMPRKHKLIADEFLEELIVRRELAFNFCALRGAPRYARRAARLGAEDDRRPPQ